MRSFMFTEAEFKAAVIKSHKAFMDSLPKPEDCPEHEFSQQFILKMQRLFALDRRRRRFRSIRRNVAAVFLTILIGLSAWLAVDTDARAAAIRWVKEFFNEFIVYRITDEDETQDMPNFVLSWMPEDIGLVSYLEDDSWSSSYYADEDGLTILTFEAWYTSDSQPHIYVDPEHNAEKLFINDLEAEYYAADDSSNTNNLIWYDEDNGVMFNIYSTLDRDTMIRIAENIEIETN